MTVVTLPSTRQEAWRWAHVDGIAAAAALAAALGAAHAAGAEKVVLADTGSDLVGFPDWAEQLIAESTGKQHVGLLPVVVEDAEAPGFVETGAGAGVGGGGGGLDA